MWMHKAAVICLVIFSLTEDTFVPCCRYIVLHIQEKKEKLFPGGISARKLDWRLIYTPIKYRLSILNLPKLSEDEMRSFPHRAFDPDLVRHESSFSRQAVILAGRQCPMMHCVLVDTRSKALQLSFHSGQCRSP